MRALSRRSRRSDPILGVGAPKSSPRLQFRNGENLLAASRVLAGRQCRRLNSSHAAGCKIGVGRRSPSVPSRPNDLVYQYTSASTRSVSINRMWRFRPRPSCRVTVSRRSRVVRSARARATRRGGPSIRFTAVRLPPVRPPPSNDAHARSSSRGAAAAPPPNGAPAAGRLHLKLGSEQEFQ